jgi:hypothetical protein
MRTIHVVVPFDVHQAGDLVEVDEQVACDAIAQGYAVPSVEAVAPQIFNPVEENRAINAAPEVK